MSRQQLIAAALVLLAVAAPLGCFATKVSDVLLVHGAWAGASSWSQVIGRLQDKGLTVHAVQLCLGSLQDDAATVQHYLQLIGKPVVVAAHSYGGAVMSMATAGQPNVTALVFAAAYAPDVGENVYHAADAYAPTPIAPYLRFDNEGQITLATPGFVRYFAAGVKPKEAAILAVVQKPIGYAAFVQNMTTPGWKTIPSYYQVSKSDKVLSPQLEEFYAKRMNAVETLYLNSGHLSPITHVKEVTALILRAVAGKPKAMGK